MILPFKQVEGIGFTKQQYDFSFPLQDIVLYRRYCW